MQKQVTFSITIMRKTKIIGQSCENKSQIHNHNSSKRKTTQYHVPGQLCKNKCHIQHHNYAKIEDTKQESHSAYKFIKTKNHTISSSTIQLDNFALIIGGEMILYLK